MRNTLLKTLVALGMLMIALQSFAKVELNLQDLRKEVLDENIDIKIQYEKYYQSQKNVSVALGQFLPAANITLINVNATLAILQSVIPTPTDWFAYQASKELRVAEKFTTETIKLNILEGLTVNFVNLKHHESLMVSLKQQETLLNEVYEEVKKKEELGIATQNDVFIARRSLLQHKQDIYMLNSLIIAEKQALLIALNKSPKEELSLGALPVENLDVIPANIEDGADLAVNNSTELLSNSYQAEAARYMVSSKKWSFISFNGIGFDYGATLSIEKSKARIIGLQSEQIALKIRNQVYAAYEGLDILDQRIELQKEVVAAVKKMDERTVELYMNNAVPFSKYYESRNAVASEERGLVKIQMERTIKVAQLKRLLGLDSSLSNVNVEEYQNIQLTNTQDAARRGAKHVWISLEGEKELLANIFSVTYTVENVIAETRMLATDSNLTLYFKAYTKGEYKVTAKIQLVSGDVIVKEELVVVK
ncbi:MAG: TolC family protein [Bdellovibrionales bacterium]|nr:TolC family protein [Bdellovibrionales bacterium]